MSIMIVSRAVAYCDHEGCTRRWGFQKHFGYPEGVMDLKNALEKAGWKDTGTRVYCPKHAESPNEQTEADELKEKLT